MRSRFIHPPGEVEIFFDQQEAAAPFVCQSPHFTDGGNEFPSTDGLIQFQQDLLAFFSEIGLD